MPARSRTVLPIGDRSARSLPSRKERAMEWWLWALIAVLVVAAVAAVAIVVAVRKQRQRTARLRERFGPEYDRAVEGGRRTGGTELEGGLQRPRPLPLSPPAQDERTRFEREWSEIEGQFEEAELPAV